MGIVSRLWNLTTVTAKQKDEDALKIGILGAAECASYVMIYPAGKLASCVVYAIAARNPKKAAKFAKKHKIPKVFDTYDDLIMSEEIDIIYNPLPNGYHAHYTIKALEAGKHVICEKPLASNEQEVREIKETLKDAAMNPKTKTKAMLIEAIHARFHPLHRRMRKMLANGELGDLKTVKSSFTLPSWGVGKSGIRYNANGTKPELAGGSLMDVGCYAISILREFVEGYFQSQPGNPDYPSFEVKEAKIKNTFKDKAGSEAIDEKAHAKIDFFNEGNEDKLVKTEVKTSFKGYGFSATIKVVGTKKELYIYNFILPFIYHYVVVKDVKTGKKKKFKEYGDGSTTYLYQLQTFIAAVRGDGEAKELCKCAGGIDNAIQNMKVIDAIYDKAGFAPRQGKI